MFLKNVSGQSYKVKIRTLGSSLVLHENRLPADDSHEISCLIRYF